MIYEYAVDILCRIGAFLKALGYQIKVSMGEYTLELGDLVNSAFNAPGITLRFPYGDDEGVGVDMAASYDEFSALAKRWAHARKRKLFEEFARAAHAFVGENRELVEMLSWKTREWAILAHSLVSRLYDILEYEVRWESGISYSFNISEMYLVAFSVCDRHWMHAEVHLVLPSGEVIVFHITPRPSEMEGAVAELLRKLLAVGTDEIDRVLEVDQVLFDLVDF